MMNNYDDDNELEGDDLDGGDDSGAVGFDDDDEDDLAPDIPDEDE